MTTKTQITPYDRGFKAGFAGEKYKNPYNRKAKTFKNSCFMNGFNAGAAELKDFKIGQAIATMLSLSVSEVIGGQNRYETLWGSKTEIGLARSVARIIEEAK